MVVICPSRSELHTKFSIHTVHRIGRQKTSACAHTAPYDGTQSGLLQIVSYQRGCTWLMTCNYQGAVRANFNVLRNTNINTGITKVGLLGKHQFG
jgi:hypothetical protein